MKLTINGHTYDVQVTPSTVVVEGHPFQVRVQGEAPILVVYINDHPYQVELPPALLPPYRVSVNGIIYEVATEQALAAPRAPAAQPRQGGAPVGATGLRPSGAPPGSVLAPVSGTITAVKVQPGQAVEAGTLLLVLEAMKMENEIKAPHQGVVREIKVAKGSRVSEGQVLAIIGE